MRLIFDWVMIPDDVKLHIRDMLAQAGDAVLSVAEIYDDLIVDFGAGVATKEQIRDYLEYETRRSCSVIYRQTDEVGHVRYFYHG